MTANHILIPSSSPKPQALIFPYDHKSRKFSTTSYTSLQTQNRLPLEEVEQFLEQANVPLKQWYEKYGWFMDPSCKFFSIAITCLIIFPLFIFFVCWHVYAKDKAEEKHDEAIENSKLFITDNKKHSVERGLMWNVPAEYPLHIELWTTVPGAKNSLPGVQTGIPI